MTKKEFKKALLRGHGRCVLAVKENPEKYRDLVMWACCNNLSFDTQCEGTRAWFIYQMVNMYEDTTPFAEATVKRLEKCHSNGGWQFSHLCELLSYFADDGSLIAEAALESRYRSLYNSLMARKQSKNGLFHERDDFEMICVILATDKLSFMRIAADIGRLYQSNSLYDGWDFAWLYSAKGKRYLTSIKKEAKTSEDIACYLEKQQDYEKESEKQWNDRPEYAIKGAALSMRLARKTDEETILRYARDYLAQEESGKRASALSAFFLCPFPLDPSPIIKDTGSSCEELRNAAWRALEKIRHPLVREFAFSQIETADICSVVSLMAKNYRPEDEDILASLVKSVPIDRNSSSGWHGVHGAVLGMKDDGIKASPSLLYYIYETTRCSCCRERVLMQMGKRRLLTAEILHECLYDSNDEIREYARRRLNRRSLN